MNGSGRTLGHTFLAELALREINISYIVLDGYGFVGTNLGTFAATNAGCTAGLACDSSLVLIDAGDKDTHIARSLVAYFNYMLRASLDTGSTSGTFVLVNLRQSGLGIH